MRIKLNIFEAVDNADTDGIAIEALIMAEEQFMRDGVTPEEMSEINEDDGFAQMAFKDDNGYWRVTGSKKEYRDHDALVRDYPDIC